MKILSAEEREIIRLIQNKEITDIKSFVQYFHLGTDIQYYKEDIEREFELKYGNMEIKITKNRNSFINKKHVIEELPNNQCMAKPYLSYSEDYSGRSHIIYNKGQVKHIYNLLEPTYICEDIDKILNFISIWKFLESEHLIIDLPKACEKQDMALFLRKKYEQRTEKYFPKDISSTSELKVDASEFMEWGLELNIHNFEICLPYLQKQIQPTLGLGTFVKHNFKTQSYLIERRNFIIALIGIIVAIITSGASIILSLWDKGNAEELNKINNSLQEIRQEINLHEK